MISQIKTAGILLSCSRFSTTVWLFYLVKKTDRNGTRMLRAVLNKFLKQHSTKQQMYCHLPPISQTIKQPDTVEEVKTNL